MKFSMTGQEKYDFLIQVTSCAGLIVSLRILSKTLTFYMFNSYYKSLIIVIYYIYRRVLFICYIFITDFVLRHHDEVSYIHQ